jgi:hypothetical protein
MLRAILAAPFDNWQRISARASPERHNRLGWLHSASRFSRLAPFLGDDMSERVIRKFTLAVDHFRAYCSSGLRKGIRPP